jgi:hypothetical protein
MRLSMGRSLLLSGRGGLGSFQKGALRSCPWGDSTVQGRRPPHASTTRPGRGSHGRRASGTISFTGLLWDSTRLTGGYLSGRHRPPLKADAGSEPRRSPRWEKTRQRPGGPPRVDQKKSPAETSLGRDLISLPAVVPTLTDGGFVRHGNSIHTNRYLNCRCSVTGRASSRADIRNRGEAPLTVPLRGSQPPLAPGLVALVGRRPPLSSTMRRWPQRY